MIDEDLNRTGRIVVNVEGRPTEENIMAAQAVRRLVLFKKFLVQAEAEGLGTDETVVQCFILCGKLLLQVHSKARVDKLYQMIKTVAENDNEP